MSPETRLLLYALLAVVALIVLIARVRLHPFIALVVVSLTMGIAAGMPFTDAIKAFQDGVGNVLGFIAILWYPFKRLIRRMRGGAGPGGGPDRSDLDF